MANLLRKLKGANDSTFHHLNINTPPPQDLDHDHTRFDDFRRKLVRKASTFSLRSKTRRGGGKSSDQRSRAHTFIAFQDEHEVYHTERNPSVSTLIGPEARKDISAPYPPPIENYRSTTTRVPRLHWADSLSRSHPNILTRDIQAEDDRICLQQKEHLQEEYLKVHQKHKILRSWAKMASEQAAPPVAYERLRQLTTEACDSTLSSIKAYAHAETESWNTAIINTILAALVTESTPTTGEAQPNYKFVVNSTIIQHAAIASGASDDAVKSAGRRGMHSASGAFWNNERDGMWSFKYEAADGKGLDVVVGIIWIWVG